MTDEQKLQIKSKNGIIIKNKGYRVNDWLPILETPALRTIDEIKGRMSVMNALINIAFEAPIYIIKEWIENQNLSPFLSDAEKKILEKDNNDLTELEINTFRWYIEALWAFMWLTEMVDSLDPEKHVGDHMVSLLPNIEQGESNKKFEVLRNIRQEVELYTMLDFYYRLHWYCVDGRLNGQQVQLNEGQIYERRKSLEWAYNSENDWDHVEMGT